MSISQAAFCSALLLFIFCAAVIYLDNRKSRIFRERRQRIAALGRPVPDSRSSQAQFKRIMDSYNDEEFQ